MAVSNDPREYFPQWEKFLRFGWLAAAIAVIVVGFEFPWRRAQPEAHAPETQVGACQAVDVRPQLDHLAGLF